MQQPHRFKRTSQPNPEQINPILVQSSLVPFNHRVASLIFGLLWILNTLADSRFFSLQTLQGHLYLATVEAIIFSAIYAIAKPARTEIYENRKHVRFGAIATLLIGASLAYKGLFISSWSNAPYISDFTKVIPFAAGPLYGLHTLADGQADAIANALYKCGLCLRRDEIPLSEPFIAYIFYGIAVISGEFNQGLIWLTLHAINLFTAVFILKTIREIFPLVRFSRLFPLLYVLTPDAHVASTLLFKDGLLALTFIILFYLNSRHIFLKRLPWALFELPSILLIALLYELRSGTLSAIILITLISTMVDRRNWVQHLRIVLLAAFTIGIAGNNADILGKIGSSVQRAYDKTTQGTSSHLDMVNLSYTTSRENSLLEKLHLNQITKFNFYYAPMVKGGLYFLLPLPIEKYSNLIDNLHRVSSFLYFLLFIFFLDGIRKIVWRGMPQELYLLAFFGICMALILGAGPMLVPRYRIMASGFFFLITALGISTYTNRSIMAILTGSAFLAVGIMISYHDLYALIERLLE